MADLGKTLWKENEAMKRDFERKAWLLAALAALFGLGFFVRIALFGA